MLKKFSWGHPGVEIRINSIVGHKYLPASIVSETKQQGGLVGAVSSQEESRGVAMKIFAIMWSEKSWNVLNLLLFNSVM